MGLTASESSSRHAELFQKAEEALSKFKVNVTTWTFLIVDTASY